MTDPYFGQYEDWTNQLGCWNQWRKFNEYMKQLTTEFGMNRDEIIFGNGTVSILSRIVAEDYDYTNHDTLTVKSVLLIVNDFLDDYPHKRLWILLAGESPSVQYSGHAQSMLISNGQGGIHIDIYDINGRSSSLLKITYKLMTELEPSSVGRLMRQNRVSHTNCFSSAMEMMSYSFYCSLVPRTYYPISGRMAEKLLDPENVSGNFLN